ncbi:MULTISPECIES: phage tail tape measure protein [Campylobacter]|uniref:phage tail tape measure protein n=1 Tax=Campylobacter TaxID=194 RepID=UPI00027A3739|nr:MULTISPECIES: phage tail tape measure protein [Campylobacter]EJP74577.1 phage tail tape measure protein, TP901 family [Campylobacter sp. FOBRC14]
MAQEATLTFNMELKGLNNILKAVDKSTISLADKLNQNIKAGVEKYNEALKELKANPFQKAGFHTQMAKLKADLQKATRAKIRLDMDEAKQKLANLKTEIVASVASIAAIAAPIKSAIDFESAMADVKKVVDFKDDKEIKGFSNEILKMSQVIPMTAEGLTQVAAAGGQMGLAKDELLKFTEMAAKTAVAFDITAESAGDTIGKIKNILSLSLDETGEMMDVINHLSNNNAAKAGEIVEVMKRIAGIGKQVGLAKEQTAALASTFISLGKAPETAATASEALLKKLNNIESLGAKQKAAFKKTGLSIKNFSAMMRKDAQGAVLKFLETMNNIEPQKRGALLSAIMGTNYDSDVATLISGMDVYKKSLDEVSSKEKFLGSNEKEFQARSNTVANKIQLMKNTLNSLSISIGNVFLPYISTAIEKITGFIKKITEFAQNNEELVKKIGFSVAAFFSFNVAMTTLKASSALLTLSLGGYRQILTMLPFDCLKLSASLAQCNFASLGFVGGLKKIVLSFRALSLAFLSNPIGAILAAIAVAGALVYKYWDHVKAFFTGFFDGLRKNIAPVTDVFNGFFGAIKSAFSPLMPIFSKISSFFSSLFGQSIATKEEIEGLTNAGAKFGEIVAAAINFVLSPLKFMIELITSAISGVNTLIDSFKKLDISGGLKDMLGVGDGADRSWYNPLNLFYDSKPKAQNTNGAIGQAIEAKNLSVANSKNNTINDNKVVNITMQGSSATPQAVAKAVQNSSYSYGD